MARTELEKRTFETLDAIYASTPHSEEFYELIKSLYWNNTITRTSVGRWLNAKKKQRE